MTEHLDYTFAADQATPVDYEFTDYGRLFQRRSSVSDEIVDSVQNRDNGRSIIAELCRTLLRHRGLIVDIPGYQPVSVLDALTIADKQSIHDIEGRTGLRVGVGRTLDVLRLAGVVEEFDDYGVSLFSLVDPDASV